MVLSTGARDGQWAPSGTVGSMDSPTTRATGPRRPEAWNVICDLHYVKRSLQCAVERRASLAGANRTQKLSLRLVAARAVHGGNDMG